MTSKYLHVGVEPGSLSYPFEDLFFLCHVKCQLFQTFFIIHDFQVLWKHLYGGQEHSPSLNLG